MNGPSDLVQMSDWSLYPALHKPEQEGWISPEWKTTENKWTRLFDAISQVAQLEEA
jgi:DNA-binding PadR family transcriptional regulator